MIVGLALLAVWLMIGLALLVVQLISAPFLAVRKMWHPSTRVWWLGELFYLLDDMMME